MPNIISRSVYRTYQFEIPSEQELNDDPNCTRRGNVPETAKHILCCHCLALSQLRTKHLDDFYITLDHNRPDPNIYHEQPHHK